jgi:16S rRNA (cytidine1402-2'-O)-methyltransferase
MAMPRTYHIGPHAYDAPELPVALYLVPTPIGNLGDVTIRALQVLAAADVIACEDTRVTAKLLDRYGIRNKLIAYHDHNAASVGASLLADVAAGKSVAIATDAGTPLLSDPGFPLVRDAVAQGLRIEALPGASALLPALQLSAQPTDRFSFFGFLPQKKSERLKMLTEIATRSETVVVYESPYRVLDALEDITHILSDRPLSVSREISKLHEETLRGTASSIHAELSARPAIKGEFAIVFGAQESEPVALTEDQVSARISEVLSDHSASKTAALLSKTLGIPRDEIYARILALKGKS